MLTIKQIFDKCTEIDYHENNGAMVAIWPKLEFSVHQIEQATHYNNRGKFHLLTNVGNFEICRFPSIVGDAIAKGYTTLTPIETEDYEIASILNKRLKCHLDNDIKFLDL